MSIRLLHGDCLEMMKDISANSVDLIICDLPYGCLNSPNMSYSGCGWDIKIDLQKFWAEAKRILKNDHSPVIHFCTTKFGIELINSNPDWFRYDLVWDKQRGVSFLQANKMPMRSHEMIYVFSKKGAFYNRVDEDAPGKKKRIMEQKTTLLPETTSNAFRPSSGVLKINMPSDKKCSLSVISGYKRGGHPTEKPCDLYSWLIERYCPPNGTVLDPTFGSGNSVMTAHAMGRHAIGIEKDDVFYKKCSDKIIPENVIS